MGKRTFLARTFASNTYASATWTGVAQIVIDMIKYYGTMREAVTYYNSRLHTYAWDNATVASRMKALNHALMLIDNLNYKGTKAAVYPLLYNTDGSLVTPIPSDLVLEAASLTQELEFPRGQDTVVPEQIKWAQWEITLAILDGFDPDAALENTRVKSQTFAAVKTTYADGDDSDEYLMYGIPNGTAWRYLKPYLCDGRIIRLRRAD